MDALRSIAVVAAALALAAPPMYEARADTPVGDMCKFHPGVNDVFYVTDRERAHEDEIYGISRHLDDGYARMSYGTAAYEPSGKVTAPPSVDFAEFVCELRAASAPDGLLVYNHGYHNAFRDAIIDAGWLHGRLGHAGPVIVYSFPAQTTGGLFDHSQYVNDETQVSWSVAHFRAMLAAIHEQIPRTQFTFLSHSLGARFLTEGLRVTTGFQGCGARPCLRNVAIFAGDIDTYALRDALDEVQDCKGTGPAARAIVVYTSRHDFALQQSQLLHAHSRAGRIQEDGHEMFSCSPVQTIDVSNHKTKTLGHWYYQDGAVIDDLKLAFAGKAPGDKQRYVRPRTSVEDKPYYEFVDPP